MKRKYSKFSIREALELIPAETVQAWEVQLQPRQPSDILIAVLDRLESFDLRTSEAGKTMLIDALLAEVIPEHPNLFVWRSAPLSTDTLTGFADYLIAPKRAYAATPLLCIVEAKRDDFEYGMAQCIAEMCACAWQNRKAGLEIDVYGIVSNGQGWRFYKLTSSGEIYETSLYTTTFLPELLAYLSHIFDICARAVPAK